MNKAKRFVLFIARWIYLPCFAVLALTFVIPSLIVLVAALALFYAAVFLTEKCFWGFGTDELRKDLVMVGRGVKELITGNAND